MPKKAATLKIYCRHPDTIKRLKQAKLDLDARSYEEALRKLLDSHERKFIKFA